MAKGVCNKTLKCAKFSWKQFGIACDRDERETNSNNDVDRHGTRGQ